MEFLFLVKKKVFVIFKFKVFLGVFKFMIMFDGLLFLKDLVVDILIFFKVKWEVSVELVKEKKKKWKMFDGLLWVEELNFNVVVVMSKFIFWLFFGFILFFVKYVEDSL